MLCHDIPKRITPPQGPYKDWYRRERWIFNRQVQKKNKPIAKSSQWQIFKETLSGEPFKPGSSAYIAASLDGEIREPNSVLLTIKAAFVPFPIKTGIIVVTECQVGTTGARFSLEAQEASLKNLTSDVQIDTNYEVSSSSGATVAVEPKVKAKIYEAEVEVSSGSIDSEKSVTKKVVFSSGEALLVGTTIGSDIIRWSLRPHAGEKAVADYLEGNLEISALGSWTEGKSPTFVSKVEPRDRIFFGPDGKPLKRLGSAALGLRLLLSGIELPQSTTIQHSLVVRHT